MNQQTGKVLCEIKNKLCELEIPAPVTPPVIIMPPCQPCIAVDGVVDSYAYTALIDNNPTYFNLDGPVDPTRIEILDDCDPRCLQCGCEPVPEPDCCDCTPDDFQSLAQTLLKGGK